MEPTLILNKDKEILDYLTKLLKKVKHFKIMVSYVNYSGLKEILPYLKNAKGEFILTADGLISDFDSIKTLYKESNIDFKIVTSKDSDKNNKRKFHTKSYYLTLDDNTEWLITGSSNISHTSFKNTFEQNVIIDLNRYKNVKEQYLEQFNYIFENVAHSLDDKELNGLEKIYSLNRGLRKINEQRRIEVLIPNSMQNEAIDNLSHLYNEGSKAALIRAATGTGKTIVSLLFANEINVKKMIFLVHSVAIRDQAFMTFSNFFPHLEKEILLKSDKSDANHVIDVLKKNIIFTTEKTLIKIIKSQNSEIQDILKQSIFDLVVFDESHHAYASTQKEIFDYFKNIDNKPFLLGMTATPNRTDFPNIIAEMFENMALDVDMEEAIDKKLISKFRYFLRKEEEDFSDKKYSVISLFKRFVKCYNDEHIKVWDDTKIKGLIFVSEIKKAEELMKEIFENNDSYLLGGKKITAAISHSKGKTIDDASLVSSIQDENSDLNFIIVIDKYNEGIDIPRLNTIVMLRPTISHIIYQQQIGRGLRTNKTLVSNKGDSKEKLLQIFDLVGNNDKDLINKGYFISPSNDPIQIFTNILVNNKEEEARFDMDEKSMAEILDRLSKKNFIKEMNNIIQTGDKFIKDKLSKITDFKINNYLNKEVEKKALSRDIALYRYENNNKKIIPSPGMKSWLIGLVNNRSNLNLSLDIEEEFLVEQLSWLPFTTSTPLEKRRVIELIDALDTNEEVNMSQKWLSYFTGEIPWKSQAKGTGIIKFMMDGKKIDPFFKTVDNSSLKWDRKISDKTRQLLDVIKEFLADNQERNNFLEPKSYYSKAEAAFMMGHTIIVQSGYYPANKQSIDNQLSPNNRALIATKIDQEEQRVAKYKEGRGFTNYSNNIFSKDEFSLALDRKYSDEILKEQVIHPFIGSTKFIGNIESLLYLGRFQRDQVEVSTKKDSKKVYTVINFKLKEKLNNEQYIQYQRNSKLIEQYYHS